MYLKVTNREENHHGFQYNDGLNILTEPFNDNPNQTCVPGGFYFTTKEHIHKFYHYGVNIRVVTFPEDDPDFLIVQDPDGNKWRANKIILGEKYPMDNPQTYTKLNIPFPSGEYCIINDFKKVFMKQMEQMDKLENDKTVLKKFVTDALTKCLCYGRYDWIQWLVDCGAGFENISEYHIVCTVANGYSDIIHLLADAGSERCKHATHSGMMEAYWDNGKVHWPVVAKNSAINDANFDGDELAIF